MDLDGYDATHTVTVYNYIYEGNIRDVADEPTRILAMFGHTEIGFVYKEIPVVISYGPDADGDSGAALAEGCRKGKYPGQFSVFWGKKAEDRKTYWEEKGFTQYAMDCEMVDKDYGDYEFILNIAYCAIGDQDITGVEGRKPKSKTVQEILNCDNGHMDKWKGTWNYALLKSHKTYRILVNTCYTARLMLMGTYDRRYKYMTPKAEWMDR